LKVISGLKSTTLVELGDRRAIKPIEEVFAKEEER
jgi:hypothetical protein